eukprot:SAG22_NODE_4044_length_1409_cov_1.211450_2_plen_81_part_01
MYALPATVMNSPSWHFPRVEVQTSAASKPQPVPPTSLRSISASVQSRPPVSAQIPTASRKPVVAHGRGDVPHVSAAPSWSV